MGDGAFSCPTCHRSYSAAGRCPVDDTTLVAVVNRPDPLVGAEIGGFTVRQRLGAGGMGAVYLAFQHSVGRNVALKVMSPATEHDPSLVKRFMREAKLSAQLSSPHIVTTLDFGQAPSGQLFLAMELVEGETLGSLVRKGGPIPWDRAVRLAMQICDALTAAHSRDIIHRDLKPQNLMVQVGPPELVKVLDFGLARSAGDSRITESDMVMGSANFIAPEIIMGGEGDARSDLYALGAVVFFMIEGRQAFGGQGTMSEIMARQLSGAPTEFNRPIPPVLGHLVKRLLATDPNKRPTSAAQARELLAATLEQQAVTPPSAPTLKVPRRRLVLPVVAAVAAIVGLGLIATSAFQSVQPPRPEEPSTDASAIVTPAVVDAGVERDAGIDAGSDDAGTNDAGTPPTAPDAGRTVKKSRPVSPLWTP